MKTSISLGAVAALFTLGFGVQAQDITGRVISSTPVVQQVQVPRQICSNQPYAVQQPGSGAGAVIGAIAGGILGNTIGHGGGRAAATILGVVGGAAVGDRIDGGGLGYQGGPQCVTQTFYENRTVAYNVTYEYGGRQFMVQMPNDPGPSLRLQVLPVGGAAPLDLAYALASGDIAISAPAGVVSVPGYVASASSAYPAYAPGYARVDGPASAPAYYPAYAPSYYSAYPGYYAPIGLSLGFGFSRGWGGHQHHHHHGHRGGHYGGYR